MEKLKFLFYFLIYLNKMKNDFDSILVSVLEKYEANPEIDMDKFLSSIISEFNLSDEDIEKIRDTHELIDLFMDKSISLEKAKNEGYSRKSWILKEFDQITDGRSEKEKVELATAISNVTESVYNSELTVENE